MNRAGIQAPIILFGLVAVVIVWDLLNGSGSAGSGTVPMWLVVVGSLSLLFSMVGGAFLLTFRNRRLPPTDSQDE